MGKKIKKAIGSATGGLIGGSQKAPKAPQAEPTPAPAAQVVEAPKEDSTVVDDSSESAKKAARSRGKRGLSVARSSGSGLNI
jgi:hypothetical protein